jgi:hypothetical protein
VLFISLEIGDNELRIRPLGTNLQFGNHFAALLPGTGAIMTIASNPNYFIHPFTRNALASSAGLAGSSSQAWRYWNPRTVMKKTMFNQQGVENFGEELK